MRVRSPLHSLILTLVAVGACLSAPEASEAQSFDSLSRKDLTYRMLGPYRGWRSTAATGFIDDPDRWIMGTTGGGIWLSTDNGVSWENISDEYFGGSIGAVKVADADANVIRDQAIKEGMRTLRQDALEKLKDGMTTPEEVVRVTRAI